MWYLYLWGECKPHPSHQRDQFAQSCECVCRCLVPHRSSQQCEWMGCPDRELGRNKNKKWENVKRCKFTCWNYSFVLQLLIYSTLNRELKMNAQTGSKKQGKKWEAENFSHPHHHLFSYSPATSVATRIGVFFFLKSLMTLFLSLWSMSPCRRPRL